MDAQEYAKDFLEGVRSEAAATGEGKCAVFVRNVAQQLVDAEVLPDFEGSFYTGTGRGNRKFRVDGYILDEFDMAMNLIIADFDEDFTVDTTVKRLDPPQPIKNKNGLLIYIRKE